MSFSTRLIGMIIRWICIGCALPALISVGMVSAYSGVDLPKGVTLEEWAKIRSQIREAAYRVEPAKKKEWLGYTANNRKQGFRTSFGRDMVIFSAGKGNGGGDWNLSMKASRYGYGDNLKPVPGVTEVVAEGNRVEYRRGEMTEWYVNDLRGVEQGFTLQKRPQGAGDVPLRIEVAVDTDLVPRLAGNGQSVLFQNEAKKTTVKYHKLMVWDAEKRKIPSSIEIADASVHIVVDERDAEYPIMIDPLISNELKLNRLYSDYNDKFGNSVSIDGNLMAIGAPFDNVTGSSTSGEGCVYVFEKKVGPDGKWRYKARLSASDASEGDRFGHSVAVNGDLMVIGAPGANSVYVYEPLQGWAETKITASNSAAGDQFGHSVSVYGDLVAVGAPYVGSDDFGSVYIYDRSQGWAEIIELMPWDIMTNGYFGYSVSVSGDLLVVGAPDLNSRGAGFSSGAAYVYDRSQGWAEKKIVPAGFFAGFGTSVSISGDIIAIGAPYEASPLDPGDEGAVYIFEPSQGDWYETKVFPNISAIPESESEFGYSVSVKGETVVIGAPKDQGNGYDSGLVVVYERSQGVWSDIGIFVGSQGDLIGQSVALGSEYLVIGLPGHADSGAAYAYNQSQNWVKTELSASHASASDKFGYSVAVSDDLVVVGVPYDDDLGSVYVYDRSQGWSETKLIASDATLDDNYGLSVSVSGDLVIVGSPYDDDGGTYSGSVYIYDRSQGWSETKLTASDAAAYDFFGESVFISGNLLVVGAFGDDVGGDNSGSVYVYDRSQSWSEIKKLTASDAEIGAGFGDSVSVSGDLVVVGAPYDDDAGNNSGSVYVYNRSQGWSETKITASDAWAEDSFGFSVSISGDLVVVGAPFDDNGGNNAGLAYVYDRSKAWSETKLTGSESTDGDEFGTSVSISGSLVMVGAPYNDNGGPDSGLVYVYDRTQQWSETKLNAFDATAFDIFGDSVAVSGGIMVVGTPRNDDGGLDSGSAYVFETNLTPSVISIERSDTNPTNAGSVQYRVIFSENVNGVDVGDFTLSGTGTAGGSIALVSENNPSDYTVTVSSTYGTGTLGLDLIDNDTIVNDQGNFLGGVNPGNGDFIGEMYTIDRDGPTVLSITSTSLNRTYYLGESINITINFSEPSTLSGGTLELILDTGAVISIPAFNQAQHVSSNYVVGSGEVSLDLDVTNIALTGGTLQDLIGNSAQIQLPATAIADGSNIVVDGEAPGTPIITGVTPTFTKRPTWHIASGGGGNGYFRYRLNNPNLQTGATQVTSFTAFDYQTPSDLDLGLHTLYVQERDAAGNWSEISSYTIHIVSTQVPFYQFEAPVATTTPKWRWSNLNGLGGSGTFRYKLNDSNMASGATVTTDLYFQPAAALPQGQHILYLQEQDEAGFWSPTSSASVIINSPANAVLIDRTILEIHEPEGENQFTIALAVKPRHEVNFTFSSDQNACLVSPSQVTIPPDSWNTGVSVTVKDSPQNLINTREIQVTIGNAVSSDPYFNGKSADPVSVKIIDDAVFTVYSITPRYGKTGEYTTITVEGSGFSSATKVFYKRNDGNETEATSYLVNSSRILFSLPDPNQAKNPPAEREEYTVIVTDGAERYEEPVTIVSISDLEELKHKKAIIVAGGGTGYSRDYLWPVTTALADKAYDTLVFQGYFPENIRYLSADPSGSQLDATLSSLKDTIRAWAAEPFGPGYGIYELFIYMTDHGDHELFTLNGRTGIDLYADDLKEWLDQLQNANPQIRVILVYDACLSGSFVPAIKAAPEASYERIILTGTDETEDAVFGNMGKHSFSDGFWNSVMDTGFLYRSFKNAESEMNGRGQHPQIKIPLMYGYENDIRIGLGLKSGASPISIERICPEQYLSCDDSPSANVWVSGIDGKNMLIQRVWAEIRLPDDAPAGTPDRIIVKEMEPEGNLDEYGDVRYSVNYDQFIHKGPYFITVFASTGNEKESDPVSTAVRQLCNTWPRKGDLNADEEVDLKDVILALQVLCGLKDVPVRPDYRNKPVLDVDNNLRVGLSEAMYALREAAK